MKIGIIGSGTMGISIGHFMSFKDNPTIIYDNSKKVNCADVERWRMKKALKKELVK